MPSSDVSALRGEGVPTASSAPDAPSGALPDEPAQGGWPAGAGDGHVVFLLDVANGFEERMLRAWIEAERPDTEAGRAAQILTIPCSRRRRGRIDPGLEPALATGGDPLLAPLRIAWLAERRDGQRQVRWRDLLTLGDPRDPGRLRSRWIARRSPERCRIVVGEPATASELRERWRRAAGHSSGATVGLAEFVVRQAALALERAERRIRGARYKVPRFVRDEVLSRPALLGELGQLSRQLGRGEPQLRKEASRYLKEIAASHSPFVIDLVVQMWVRLFFRSYGDTLHYDPEEVDRLRHLSQQHPMVFLPTHKSNLDHGVLQTLLHENGLPPNHTAGGINMNFFPLGPLVRRSGVFFIRRTFKDLPVYKAVLRHYIDYLIEKRFPLEWYIEGGRSRSGKLLPPRFGLLAYVVDAYRRGRADDVQLIPVSICYDQISDVGDYASEQLGGVKQKEGFTWFLGIIRRLGRKYGEIFIRFGEPVSLAKALGPADPEAEPDPDEDNLALQKLAFEVCVQINRATPITPISLVCLSMLGRGDRALSASQMVGALENLVHYVGLRKLDTTEPLDLDREVGIAPILEELAESGLLERFDGGVEPVYRIADDQHLAAAYYRNTVIHYFVTGAIAELSLIRAAEQDVDDRMAAFWDMAMELRDLLKFEFFFAEKEVFRREVEQELALHDARWADRIAEGPDAIGKLLRRIRPLSAHRILRPFLEAYRVVADVLVDTPAGSAPDSGEVVARSLSLGLQYSWQKRVKRQESISKTLFGTALKLARNRGLLEADVAASDREDFAEELQSTIRRIDAVESLVRARHMGLF